METNFLLAFIMQQGYIHEVHNDWEGRAWEETLKK